MARSSRSTARKTRQTNNVKVSDTKKKATAPKASKEKIVSNRNKTIELSTPRVTRNSKTHPSNVKDTPKTLPKRTRDTVVAESPRATRSKRGPSPPPKMMRTRSTVRQNIKANITNTASTAVSAKSQSLAKKNLKTEKKRVVFKAITPPKKLATKSSIKMTTKSKHQKNKSPVKKMPTKTTKKKKPPAKSITPKKKPTQTSTAQRQPTRGRRSTQRSEASVKTPPISRARRSMHRSNEKSSEGEMPSDQPFQIIEEGNDSMEVAEDLKAEIGVREEGEQKETTKNVESVDENSTGKEKEENEDDGKRKLEDEHEVPAKKAKMASPSKTEEEETLQAPEKVEEKSPINETKVEEQAVDSEKMKTMDEEKESSIISEQLEETNEKVEETINGDEEQTVEDKTTEVRTDDAETEKKVSEDSIPFTNDKEVSETKEDSPIIPDQIPLDETKKVEDTQNSSEKEEKTAKVDCPTTNGVTYEAKEFELISASNSLISRRRLVTSAETEEKSETAFSLVSYNCRLATANPDGILKELETLDAEVLCLQDVGKECYTDILQPHLKKCGYRSGVFHEGLVTFYKSELFDLVEGKESDVGHAACDVYHMVMKDVENTSLDDGEKQALKTFLRQSAYALYVKLRSIKLQKNVCICNTNLPDVDLGMHAFQLAVLMRELTNQSEGSGNPHLICGTLNLKNGSPGLQVLKDGYLSEEMIEDLQSRKNVPIPDKDNAALIDLLWKCFQHTSSTLKSSYEVILGEENVKHFGSKDSIWHSSDSLRVVGVLDLINDTDDSEINHVSLKAKFNFIDK